MNNVSKEFQIKLNFYYLFMQNFQTHRISFWKNRPNVLQAYSYSADHSGHAV
jgi:hypothetical protein